MLELFTLNRSNLIKTGSIYTENVKNARCIFDFYWLIQITAIYAEKRSKLKLLHFFAIALPILKRRLERVVLIIPKLSTSSKWLQPCSVPSLELIKTQPIMLTYVRRFSHHNLGRYHYELLFDKLRSQ